MSDARKALVSGGAGFIGSHLCDALLAQGFSVVCVDDLSTGSESNIEHLFDVDEFMFVVADVSVENPVLDSLEVDWVFHLASPASLENCLRMPLEVMMVGSAGTHNMLQIARRCGARFLFTSSSEVYGDSEISPQPEHYWGSVNPVGARSMYDEAKRYAEALTMVFVETFDVDARIVRLFNTYGPRMDVDGKVVQNFVMQALRGGPLTVYGDGSQTRSFCYVDDTVAGLLCVMHHGGRGEVYNIGNPKEMTILDLAECVSRFVESECSVVYKTLPSDDPKRRCPDITKMQKLGWEPTVELEQGLSVMFDFFKLTVEE